MVWEPPEYHLGRSVRAQPKSSHLIELSVILRAFSDFVWELITATRSTRWKDREETSWSCSMPPSWRARESSREFEGRLIILTSRWQFFVLQLVSTPDWPWSFQDRFLHGARCCMFSVGIADFGGLTYWIGRVLQARNLGNPPGALLMYSYECVGIFLHSNGNVI